MGNNPVPLTWDPQVFRLGHCDAVMQMGWLSDGCEPIEYGHGLLIHCC